MLILVSGAVLWFTRDSGRKSPAASVVSSIQKDISMVMSKVQQTASRNGITEWSLNAASAALNESQKQAVFTSPVITFFARDQGRVHLEADQGVVRTDTNDIRASGHVLLKNGEYTLKTREVNYSHEKRFFSMQAPVEIQSMDMNLAADSAWFDLNARKAFFQGNIRGSFGEGLQL